MVLRVKNLEGSGLRKTDEIERRRYGSLRVNYGSFPTCQLCTLST